jgi:glycosyltransferase involved in cell wall biosynthesis
MYSVDIHVIQQACDPSWTKQCYESLEKAQANIYIFSQGSKSLAENRKIGFQLGSADYVALVDNDDYIFPDIIPKCVKILDDNPEICGVYTGERYIDAQGNTLKDVYNKDAWNPRVMVDPRVVHNLSILRREAVEKSLHVMDKYPHIPEYAMKVFLLNYGSYYHLAETGYAWRLHGKGAHRNKKMKDFIETVWFAIEQIQKYEERHKL